jgi:hypothetical protein
LVTEHDFKSEGKVKGLRRVAIGLTLIGMLLAQPSFPPNRPFGALSEVAAQNCRDGLAVIPLQGPERDAFLDSSLADNSTQVLEHEFAKLSISSMPAEVEVLEVLLEGEELRTVAAIPFETEQGEAAFILLGVESDGTRWAIGVIPTEEGGLKILVPNGKTFAIDTFVYDRIEGDEVSGQSLCTFICELLCKYGLCAWGCSLACGVICGGNAGKSPSVVKFR